MTVVVEPIVGLAHKYPWYWYVAVAYAVSRKPKVRTSSSLSRKNVSMFEPGAVHVAALLPESERITVSVKADTLGATSS